MDTDLTQKAVSSALDGNWKEAVELNKEILKVTPSDIDALNRLARAYAELGNFKKAKTSAERVLKLDPFNPIAAKAIKKWQDLKGAALPSFSPPKPKDFLEEPGKTKVVGLLHLGDTKVLAKLDSGDEVEIVSRGHKVCVVTKDGKYVGRLTDDLSARLRNLMKLGNEYQVLVKSIDPEDVKIFIREIRRAEKLADVPSFSPEKIDYISFTPPELVAKSENRAFEQPDEEE